MSKLTLRSFWPLKPHSKASNVHDLDAPVEHVSAPALIEQVRDSVIGRDHIIETPFGARVLTYADFTASGRMVQQVEDFMLHEVGPLYANTHSDLSATGRQTNHYREEARAIVHEHLRADPDEYAVLFAGTGMTGCVHKLIDCLGIRLPEQLRHLQRHLAEEARPVVFVGPFEHHSNILSWRETIADVVEVPELEATGRLDLGFLRRELAKYKHRRMRIVSVSAGSNVTGIVTNLGEIARAAHEGGALIFADYAAAGPYVEMSMRLPNGAELDALFLSPHKLIGGPGASGVLVARRSLLENTVPSQPGGGTVSWVDSEQHAFASAIEAREDGGTPAILQAIRTGVTFQLRKLVTVEATQELSSRSCARALERWRRHPNILLMGAERGDYFRKGRLPIVSFNIAFDPPVEGADAGSEGMFKHAFTPSQRARGATPSSALHGSRRMLHPHFVCALLNDLYGIQARSGCSCAGPYGIRLWGLTPDEVNALRSLVSRTGLDAAKPGWCRVNLCWSMSDAEVELVISAVEQLATHGWKLLPLYETAWQSGAYRHRAWDASAHLKWICVVCAERHEQGRPTSPPAAGAEPATARAPSRASALHEAQVMYERAHELAAPHAASVLRPGGDFVDADAGKLAPEGAPGAHTEARAWMHAHYAFPSDAARLLGLRADGATEGGRVGTTIDSKGRKAVQGGSGTTLGKVSRLVETHKERRAVCAS